MQNEQDFLKAIDSCEFDKADEMLEKINLNINFKDAQDRSALMYATSKGKISLIEKLIKKGAEIDAQDNEGSTSLMIATDLWRTDAASVLINNGANIGIINKKGQTPYNSSVKSFDIPTMYLFDNSIIEGDAGNKLLIEACKGQHGENVVFMKYNILFLKEKGLDFRIEFEGETAIDVLSKNNELPGDFISLIVKEILSEDIDIYEDEVVLGL